MTGTPSPQSVVVPVEPTEAMLVAPDDAGVGLYSREVFAQIWAAMLAAAPAAPQAAGVGEDVRKAIARIIFPESERVKMDREWGGNRNHSRNRWTKALEQADQIIALRAPSRDPEGRAVWTGSADYEPTDAMIDAGEYHNHRHNPLTNMVASFKAMMAQAEIDGLISSTSALATREEAPACEMCNGRGEVGGPTGQTPESFEYVTERCPDCGGAGKHEAPAEGAGDDVAKLIYEAMKWAAEHAGNDNIPAWVEGGNSFAQDQARSFIPPIVALRARSSAPEAREEALGNLLAVIHGDGGHRALEVGTKQAALEAEKIVAGLFAAPSADKLRDILVDLTSWFTKPVQGQSGMVWVIPAGEMGADDALNAALAALKAEG